MTQKNLRQLARKLASQTNEQLLRLGNVLVAISESKLYMAWGYKTWDDYLKEEIGISQVQAWHLQTMSRWARIMNLTVKQRERFGRLGRYKAVVVTKLCTKKSRVNHYLKMAENNTYRFLQAEQRGVGQADIPMSWAIAIRPVQRQSIDEALVLASETSEAQNYGDLLTAICEDYLKRYKKSRKGKTAMN